MDRLATLEYGLRELREVVSTIDDAEMDNGTNCEPWTVRRLASHALNNQLLWAGLVAGRHLVANEVVTGAEPIPGDLAPVAADVAERALALWSADGILDSLHVTPFGELPGVVVIDFAIIDAVAHAWDLSSSLGRAVEFDEAAIPSISEVVAATCTDAARDHGLIKQATDLPADATDTERLMAAAGRAINR